jgi:hypothetical protein
MKSIPSTVLVCELLISALALAAGYNLAFGAAGNPAKPTSYTLTPINAEMWGPVDINDKGDVLIERQLTQFASPAPLIIKKNSKETAAFECPETTNDTDGEGINNHGDIVGHCGHDARALGLFAFVANPKTGSLTLLAYPDAQTTWGYGINDFGQVVGFYANQPEPPFCCNLPPRHLHSFFWDKATNQYRTIDNPLAELVGGWTWLKGINNKGQMVGHYNTLTNVPWEEYQFIYDNGTFTPIEFPGAAQTHITGFNNNSQIFGWYTDSGCHSMCLFLFDSGEYFKISVPLPDNAPYPNGMFVQPASLINVGGLNDNGQFVGTYHRILEWGPDPFYPEEFAPTKTELVNFIATPAKPGKSPKAGKKKTEMVN